MGCAVGGIPIPLAMQTLPLGDFILSCAASEHLGGLAHLGSTLDPLRNCQEAS